MLWFKAPPKIYFKRGSLDLGLAGGAAVALPFTSGANQRLAASRGRSGWRVGASPSSGGALRA